MARDRSSVEDLFAKSIGVAFAVGALGLGVAAALMNQERARQVRAEIQVQLDELRQRIDELSAQAAKVIDERRPDFEDTIAKSRQAVVGSLDKARTAVEQGAGKAQDYVQKATQQASGATDAAASTASATMGDTADTAGATMDDVAGNLSDSATDPGTGAETRDLNLNGNDMNDGTVEGPQ